MKLSCVG